MADWLVEQRKLVVANKMLEKSGKVYVEEKKKRLLNFYQSASGEVRFGGDTRSLERITATKYERFLEAAQTIFDDDDPDFENEPEIFEYVAR